MKLCRLSVEKLEPRVVLSANTFVAFSGEAAADYELPADVQLTKRFELPVYDLTYERYQQTFNGADVFGGQTTLYRDLTGDVVAVVGAHYPDIAPSNQVALSPAAARGLVDADIGPIGHRTVELLVNAKTGRYFYQIETQRNESRWFHWIDTGNGQVLNRYNALAHGSGIGVLGDTKDLTGLTTQSGSSYLLQSSDGRQETHDQGSSRRPFLGPIATDSDDQWDTPGRESPGQGSLVDVQYYANLTDDYLSNTYGFDWVSEVGKPMEIHAHFTKNYVNAGWNGSYVIFGDGDGVNFNPLTSLDVVSHELTHAVTEATSNLIYQGESGALNEAFSDIIGSSTEFYAEANGLEDTNYYTADWKIGEDFDLRVGHDGFRNMGDPTEDGDRDHYSERYTGTSDNGGVHTNSGIPNHAFYLLVNGGSNAGEAHGHHHRGPVVTPIPLADAEAIFFMAFATLPSDATMVDAATATVAVAGLYGLDAQQSTTDAWCAVGVGDCTTIATPVITSNQTSPTNADPINFSVDFGTVVTGFDISDLTIGNGTPSHFATIDNQIFTFDVSPTIDGLVTVDIAASVAQDSASNDNAAATRFSITSDQTAPTPVIMSTQASPTIADPINFRIDFGEMVSDFEISDLTIGNGTPNHFATSDNQMFTFDVSAVPNVTVTVDIGAAAAVDTAGNANSAAIPFSIETIGFDFGDAPLPYPSSIVDSGARHGDTGPSLGLTRDAEPDGQPTTNADGDGADEDGVMFGTIQLGAAMAGINLDLQNALTAQVDAWIDFDGNDSWDASDQILDNVTIGGGLQTINFTVPAGAVAGDTYARIRVSTAGDLETTGFADDGEVEDYLVNILPVAPQVESVVINDGVDATRSKITSVTVTFADEVDHTALETAFTVTNITSSIAIGAINVAASDSGGKTIAVLTFEGASTIAPLLGSLANTLADGNYRLDITAGQVQNAAGTGATMESDFGFGGQTAGEANNDDFFRWYGDNNGDGFTDFTDFANGFLPAFGSSNGDASYNEGLDQNGDGFVDFTDFANGFLPKFGTVRP